MFRLVQNGLYHFIFHLIKFLIKTVTAIRKSPLYKTCKTGKYSDFEEAKRGKTGLVQNENLILTSQLPVDPVKAKTNTARHDYATEFVL